MKRKYPGGYIEVSEDWDSVVGICRSRSLFEEEKKLVVLEFEDEKKILTDSVERFLSKGESELDLALFYPRNLNKNGKLIKIFSGSRKHQILFFKERSDSKAFKFLDLLGSKNTKGSLLELNRLFTLNYEPNLILSMISNQIRNLLCSKCKAEGTPDP